MLGVGAVAESQATTAATTRGTKRRAFRENIIGPLVCRLPGKPSVHHTRRSRVALRRRLSTGFAFVATPFEASDPAELLARLSLPGQDFVSSSARRTDSPNFGRAVSTKCLSLN